MIATILGIQKLDFEGQNGRVAGTNLFTAFSDENVQGYRVERFFVRESISLPKDLKLNTEYDLTFDRKARIERVEAVKN